MLDFGIVSLKNIRLTTTKKSIFFQYDACYSTEEKRIDSSVLCSLLWWIRNSWCEEAVPQMEVKVICISLSMFICSSRSCKACSHFCTLFFILHAVLLSVTESYSTKKALTFSFELVLPFSFLAAKVVQLTDLNSVVFSLCLVTSIAEPQIYWPSAPARPEKQSSHPFYHPASSLSFSYCSETYLCFSTSLH